jgi:hypothetical protein
MATRLPQLLHYVIWRCDPSELGATKLNKICWYSDLDAYRSLGRTITGATEYIRLQFGPTPRGVHNVIEQLSYEGKLAVSRQNFYGHPKTMYLSRIKPEIRAFSAEEVAIIDSVAEVICSKHSATSISRLSHDALWEEIELGAPIPIAAAAVIPGEITADDVSWAERAIADFDEHRPPA